MFLTHPVPRTVEDIRQELSPDKLLDILEKQQQLQVRSHSDGMVPSTVCVRSTLVMNHYNNGALVHRCAAWLMQAQ